MKTSAYSISLTQGKQTFFIYRLLNVDCLHFGIPYETRFIHVSFTTTRRDEILIFKALKTAIDVAFINVKGLIPYPGFQFKQSE